VANSTYLNTIKDDPVNRHPQDFYPTPRRATEALINAEKFKGKIWEPACGDGAISTVLEQYKFKVVSSELYDRGYGETGVDFLKQTKPRAPNIITNPPFKLAEEFVWHALSLTTSKVAMLCRVAWLEGQKRRHMFLGTPLARVHVFSSRLGMARNGDPRYAEAAAKGGMVAFAWYVWDHDYSVGNSPTLHWLP